MKKLVIFGLGQIAELAHFYFQNDSEFEVVAFCADKEFIDKKTLFNLPVISFDKVLLMYPPSNYYFFVALSYSKLNNLRKDKYLSLKNKGYKLASYISSKATILNDNNFGDNCFVLEDNTIQPFVKVGNNVFLWSGNHIGHHSIIDDHVFIASHVVISGSVRIEESCFVGVNATIINSIVIGKNSIIGASALILKDIESDGVYPAKGTIRSKINSKRFNKL